jgi:hypothetical protein
MNDIRKSLYESIMNEENEDASKEIYVPLSPEEGFLASFAMSGDALDDIEKEGALVPLDKGNRFSLNAGVFEGPVGKEVLVKYRGKQVIVKIDYEDNEITNAEVIDKLPDHIKESDFHRNINSIFGIANKFTVYSLIPGGMEAVTDDVAASLYYDADMVTGYNYGHDEKGGEIYVDFD